MTCVCSGELSEHERVDLGHDEPITYVCHHAADCTCTGYYPEWAQVAVVHGYGLEGTVTACGYCGAYSAPEEDWQCVTHNAGCEVMVELERQAHSA